MEDEAPKKPILFRLLRPVVLLVAGIVLFGAAWWLVDKRPGAAGPMYQGKTAKEWLREVATTNQMKAFEAFHAMGSNAAPFLVREIGRKNSAWDNFYAGLYPRLPSGFRKHLSWPFPELVRWNKAEMMLVNVDARSVMPELIHLLKEGNNQQQFCAIRGIVNFVGPTDGRYAPDLIQSLQSTNTLLHYLSAIALGRIGQGAKAAVPALTNLLDSLPPEKLREQVLLALKRIDPKAAEKYEKK